MSIQKSILQTIAFFDLFDFPLTAEEIKEYLYNSKNPIHIKEIKGTLEEIENVEKIHDYYVLKGRGNLIDLRKSRKFIAEKFWVRVRQYCQYVVQVPFVEMVAVCNNLAYDNPTELSDIDLFIVIKEGRMWIARLWISLILQFFGVRRHGNKIAGRFCLSFFVTPKKLNMETLLLKPEDPYMAYWTRLLMPIYGKKMYQEFIEANEKWLKEEYGLHFSDLSEKKFSFHDKTRWKKFWEWVLSKKFGDLAEYFLKKTFKKRTYKKAKRLGPEASIVVSDNMLKFHNLDRREEYRKNWKSKIS
ncbi:hypothetical protein ACFL6I_21760 [candidate division KSB1 bacterium]